MSSFDAHAQWSAPVLAELAKSYGVLPRYRDSSGDWRECSARSIYQVLVALGAEVDGERATMARRQALWNRMIEPVLLWWEGKPSPVLLRMPAGEGRTVEATLLLEDGAEYEWQARLDSLRTAGEEQIADRGYAARWMPRPPGLSLRYTDGLPFGYHRLSVRCGRLHAEATVICAPGRCWGPQAEREPSGVRGWGVFAPLYGLRSDRDWGAGDLADLAQLGTWVAGAGGTAVATLPLLAAYLDEPFEPAPYRPVSRLFWNEFYLAVERTAEWAECASARELWRTEPVQEQIALLRAADTVDYRGVMALKRSILERLSECFFERAGEARRRAFARYLETHPLAEKYAAFRSGGGARQTGADSRYHLYCQWQMDEQLGRFSAEGGVGSSGSPAGLVLDVPVGVHPHGFDTSHWSDAFAHSLSTGAPPDVFFALGQNWDTPPLHPERAREQGHRYLAAYLREQMRHASYLRIDHFMGLHRLFCIPQGSEAKDGVYVTYPADEQYAVLCLESHRNRTVVVGEDLGTVPPEVRRGMRRHGVLGTYVLQFALRPRAAKPVDDPPALAVAAVNTHDTFPFAGFVAGDDIVARLETGQVDQVAARRELAARRRLVARLENWLTPMDGAMPDEPIVPRNDERGRAVSLLARVIGYLARTDAQFLLVTLEDLWGETLPQNQPGTGAERGNWERKLAATREEAEQAVGRVAQIIGAGRAEAQRHPRSLR